MAKIQGNIGTVQAVYGNTGEFLGLSNPNTPGDGVDIEVATYSKDINGSITGLDGGNLGSLNLTQFSKKKDWRFMEALIGAPAYSTLTASVSTIVNGQIIKHSSGQLLICSTAGTIGASEPTLSLNGVLTDGTVTWIVYGRASNVATGVPLPTVSNSVSAGAKVINRVMNVNADVYTKQSYFAGGLTPTQTSGGSERVWRFTDSTAAKKATGGYEFYSDSSAVFIDGQGGAASFKVYVDILDGYGYRLVEESTTFCADNYKIDWNGVRVTRLYRVIFSLGSSGFSSQNFSVNALLDTVTIGDLATKKRTRAVYLGDSYGATRVPDINGAGAQWNEEMRLAMLVGYGIGADYVYDLSNGGTGYLQVATAGTIRTNITLNPIQEVLIDYVFIASGYNDRGNAVPSNVGAEALLTWQAARVNFPNAKIIVITAWHNRDNTANTTAMEASLSSNFTTWADANSVLIKPMSSEAYAWVSGTGYSGSTNGSGNSDFYLSTDNVHLSPAGVLYMADNIVRASRAALSYI